MAVGAGMQAVREMIVADARRCARGVTTIYSEERSRAETGVARPVHAIIISQIQGGSRNASTE